MKKPDPMELEFVMLLFIVGGGFAASCVTGLSAVLQWISS